MEVLADLISRSKVKCGLATLADVETNQLDDRMESFVLSETLKYLYLLFDEANEFSNSDSNFVFTTEGHILLLNSTHLNPISETRRRARLHEHPQCPMHRPVVRPYTHGLVYGIRSRPEFEYARHLTGHDMFGDVAAADSGWWDAHGTCEVPREEVLVSISLLCEVSGSNPYPALQTYDFFLAEKGTKVTEDTSAISLQSKIFTWMDGLLFQNVAGVRVHATSRPDGRGYDITKSASARFLSWIY
jgi:mannosidase alpha-like ER degradation enhancer 1